MKAMLRITLVVAALLVLAAGSAYFFREALIGIWIGRELDARLSAALSATVRFEGVEWRDDVLRAARCRISGETLPFDSLNASKLRTGLDWNRIKDPFGQPLSIEAATAEITLRAAKKSMAARETTPGAQNFPKLNFSIARFALLSPGREGWSIRDTALRGGREGDAWTASMQGGAITIPNLPPLRLKELSANLHNSDWVVDSFTVNDELGGEASGSVRRDSDTWSGKFTWKNLDASHFLQESAAQHFTGKCSGTATLNKGVLSGDMMISEAETKTVPTLVKMASLFAGEKWDSVPWETFSFAFVREANGAIQFSNLSAVSPKGLIVRGSGRIAPDSIAVKLELGVRREGRPWLVAFMPVLFRSEREGYFWTPINVGGTLESPSEDLTPRVVAALAAVPASGAVNSAIEIPGNAIEAAGTLLDTLMGK